MRLPDKFESQPLDFFSRVSNGYLRRWQQQPQRFARIDADRLPESVRQSVLQAVQQKGWLA